VLGLQSVVIVKIPEDVSLVPEHRAVCKYVFCLMHFVGYYSDGKKNAWYEQHKIHK
jgi:hypothetical protein